MRWDRDVLGLAIHKANKVGGPWGPPCGYVRYPDGEYIEVGYNEDPTGEFSCLCQSMAGHLIELMDEITNRN